MASAKIATLAIRTLAKPIATQIKQQAAEHPTFRALCIGLAQLMHRIEMRMRSNLLGANTEHQKIRPLSESKAIANGANAISEGFLFAVAAALIIGESYRSSRSNAKQRNRTEEAVEEVRESVLELTRALGWSEEELEARKRARKREAEAAAAAGGDGSEASVADTGSATSPGALTLTTPAELERERLQRAVQVLLRLALRQGWVQGQEALDLDAILTGREKEAPQEAAESAAALATTQRDGRDGNTGHSAKVNASAGQGGVQDQIAALGRSAVVISPSPSTSTPSGAEGSSGSRAGEAS